MVLRLALLSAGMLAASSAMAGGGAVVFGAASTSAVPMLNEWSMLVLALFVGVIALRSVKAKEGFKRLMSFLLAAASVGFVAKQGLMGKAFAVPLAVSVTGPGSWSFNFNPAVFTNNSGQPLQVLSLTTATGVISGQSPACTVGLTVAVGSTCAATVAP